MTAQEEFESAINAATTLDEALAAMEKFAPKKNNCFSCHQRFIGGCPIFKASKTEINILCKVSFETLTIVSAICCIGCEIHD